MGGCREEEGEKKKTDASMRRYAGKRGRGICSEMHRRGARLVPWWVVEILWEGKREERGRVGFWGRDVLYELAAKGGKEWEKGPSRWGGGVREGEGQR